MRSIQYWGTLAVGRGHASYAPYGGESLNEGRSYAVNKPSCEGCILINYNSLTKYMSWCPFDDVSITT